MSSDQKAPIKSANPRPQGSRAWRVARKGRVCPSQRSSSYCLAIRSKNMAPRIAHRAMIRAQPERQKKYGGDETEGARVFGRTDQDNGTGFAAKHDSGCGVFGDRKDRFEANANGAKSGGAGDQPDRRGWDDGGVCGVPETHEARVVDCCGSDFRNDGGGHGSDTHVQVGQKRTRETAGSSGTRNAAGKLDRAVRPGGRRRDERNGSLGATDDGLPTREDTKNTSR